MGICGSFQFLLCGHFPPSLASVSSIYFDCSPLTSVQNRRDKKLNICRQVGKGLLPTGLVCVCGGRERRHWVFIFTFGLFAHYPTWFHQFSTSHFVSKETGPAPSFLIIKFRGRQMPLDEDKLRTCLPQAFFRDVVSNTMGCTNLSVQRIIFDLQPS